MPPGALGAQNRPDGEPRALLRPKGGGRVPSRPTPTHRRFTIITDNPFVVSGDGYLTERQAADYYGLSPRSLRNWRSLGTGPRYFKISGSVRYRRADLDAYATERGAA